MRKFRCFIFLIGILLLSSLANGQEIVDKPFIKGYVKEICTRYGAVDESVSFKRQSEAIGKCPHCGGEVKKGQFGYYCTKKCGMYLAKVFGKTLTDNQLTRLLDGKEISYTVDGKKTIVMPEAVEHTYNGKTSWQWKTRKG